MKHYFLIGDNMTIKVFRISGEFTQAQKKQPFTMEIRALNAGTAIQRVFSNLGSKHKLKQRGISIKEVKEIEAKDAKDLLVQQLSGV